MRSSVSAVWDGSSSRNHRRSRNGSSFHISAPTEINTGAAPEGFITVDSLVAQFVNKDGFEERLSNARQRLDAKRRAGGDFKATLAGFRCAVGMSQAQLAKAIGSTQSAISLYESRQREPSLATLIALKGALSISLDDLVAALI